MTLGHYSLPKGHVEKNETKEKMTALIEIKEETNLDAKLYTNFRYVITYSPKENTVKDVVFFAAEIISNNPPKNQISEVQQILFLPFEKALEILTYDTEKEILIEANKYLLKILFH